MRHISTGLWPADSPSNYFAVRTKDLAYTLVLHEAAIRELREQGLKPGDSICVTVEITRHTATV